MSHLVHNSVSVLCVAGGEGKAAKFSAGSFYPASQADYGSCTQFTEGKFLIKTTRRTAGMEIGRKRHAATGSGCMRGGLLKMRLISAVFLLPEEEKRTRQFCLRA